MRRPQWCVEVRATQHLALVVSILQCALLANTCTLSGGKYTKSLWPMIILNALCTSLFAVYNLDVIRHFVIGYREVQTTESGFSHIICTSEEKGLNECIIGDLTSHSCSHVGIVQCFNGKSGTVYIAFVVSTCNFCSSFTGTCFNT